MPGARGKWRGGRGLVLLGALLGVGAVAQAQEARPASEPPFWQSPPGSEPPVAPREPASPEEPAGPEAVRPQGAVRGSLLTGIPDLISVSVSLSSWRPLEVEFGLSTAILTASAYVRAGVALPLMNARDSASRGWTVHALLMGGYRLLGFQSLLQGGSTSHGLTANTGLEAVNWFGPHQGLDLQLVIGGVSWFASSGPASSLTGIPDVRFAIGMAF